MTKESISNSRPNKVRKQPTARRFGAVMLAIGAAIGAGVPVAAEHVHGQSVEQVSPNKHDIAAAQAKGLLDDGLSKTSAHPEVSASETALDNLISTALNGNNVVVETADVPLATIREHTNIDGIVVKTVESATATNAIVEKANGTTYVSVTPNGITSLGQLNQDLQKGEVEFVKVNPQGLDTHQAVISPEGIVSAETGEPLVLDKINISK